MRLISLLVLVLLLLPGMVVAQEAVTVRGDPQADARLGPSDTAGDRRRGILVHGCHCGRARVLRLVCRSVPAATQSTLASFLITG
jgi:hypothetical protein